MRKVVTTTLLEQPPVAREKKKPSKALRDEETKTRAEQCRTSRLSGTTNNVHQMPSHAAKRPTAGLRRGDVTVKVWGSVSVIL